MLDLIYLLGTLAVFGGLLGYLRACERIGKRSSPDVSGGQERLT